MLSTDPELAEAVAEAVGEHIRNFTGLIQLWMGFVETNCGVQELLEVPVARHRSHERQKQADLAVISTKTLQLVYNPDFPRCLPLSCRLSREPQPLPSVEVAGHGLGKTGGAIGHR